MMASADGEELVQSVKLYNKRSIFLHGYIGPFIIIYAVWGFVWASWFPSALVTDTKDFIQDQLPIVEDNLAPTNDSDGNSTSFSSSGETIDDSSVEAGLIGLGIIFVIQSIIYLLCHWSVHAKAFLTCSKVTIN